ncbi:unnamed protein product [Ixodes hexagonus]
MAVGRIGEYRLGANASSDEYVERLEMFCEANKITKEEQKKGVRLSCCGEETYGLIVTQVKPARPTTASYDAPKAFGAVCKVFVLHKKPGCREIGSGLRHGASEASRRLRLWRRVAPVGRHDAGSFRMRHEERSSPTATCRRTRPYVQGSVRHGRDSRSNSQAAARHTQARPRRNKGRPGPDASNPHDAGHRVGGLQVLPSRR